MMRKPPNISPPGLLGRKVLSEKESLSVQLKLLTPMFGGSAVAGEVDTQVPIRAAAIRGHLRFWWRATIGAQYADSEKLFQEESKIWGSADEASSVKIWVDRIYDTNPFFGKIDNDRKFLLFPFLNDTRKFIERGVGMKNVSFNLCLRYPMHLNDDVQATLRAWIVFGGVGARTRRGCGALFVDSDQSKWLPSSINYAWFHMRNLKHNSNFTNLYNTRIFIGEAKNSERCWQDIGRFWAKFRKGHFLLNHGQETQKVKGLWSDHSTLQSGIIEEEGVANLNKPYLGLPLLYQKFSGVIPMGLNAHHPNGERFASPVIMKPVAFANGKICPMIAITCGPLPEEITICKDKNKNTEIRVRLQVPDSEEVLEHLKAKDPLDAVCKAALAWGYEEVTL